MCILLLLYNTKALRICIVVLMSLLKPLWTRSALSPNTLFYPSYRYHAPQPSQYCELIKILFTVNWRGDFQVFRRHHFAASPSSRSRPLAADSRQYGYYDYDYDYDYYYSACRSGGDAATTHTRRTLSFPTGKNPRERFLFLTTPALFHLIDMLLSLSSITQLNRYSYPSVAALGRCPVVIETF